MHSLFAYAAEAAEIPRFTNPTMFLVVHDFGSAKSVVHLVALET